VLRVTGVNPIMFRVSGIVQINGTLDVSGGKGQDASGSTASGGAPGAGGGRGGSARRGLQSRNYDTSSCNNFSVLISRDAPIKAGGPFSNSGEGPGRGMTGGEAYHYAYNDAGWGATGTGGGGGSHATEGAEGEDRGNPTRTPGSAGTACTAYSTAGGQDWHYHMSSVIGVRGMPGPTYGDPEIIDITWGGSGGGAGGSTHAYSSSYGRLTGAGGGGGGGSATILAAGPVIAPGGVIDASGGDGGKGLLMTTNQSQGWYKSSGGGGGGAGGSLVIISGDAIEMAGALLDATGGQGGPRGTFSSYPNCPRCNAGGDGGRGFIYLMDSDGQVAGLLPGLPGSYPNDSRGWLTISKFETSRFSSIAAITELFAMPAADPAYQALVPADIVANVNPGQRIIVSASSTRADGKDPLLPDIGSEIGTVEMARVSFVAGAIVVQITGDMSDLNPNGGVPDRDAFVRVRADFEYDNGVEAALGPFAWMDEVTISMTFNG
jgi:hypothetical protein